ncbi:hypothetical protein BJV82DRAFT_575124 [Fennellomyces sp. T-0311]|nr:hypothetical protein BJV82DRAFT_575124 [Fennellomyces sp. T-0311]
MGSHPICHHEERMAAGHNALTERKYAEVIQLSTQSLDELMRRHVLQFLDLRSVAYEKQGLLSRALDDAMLMIQYVPTSTAGYLRAGSIHISNGKPSLAAENYRQGLQAVLESHPKYRLMLVKKNAAQLAAQSRFDIVGNLPLELLHKVLAYLHPEHVWMCLNVCLKWRNQVSRCDTWWHSAIVKQTGTELDQAVRNTLDSLKLDFGSGKSFPLLMVLGSCPKIRQLSYTTDGTISFSDQDARSSPGCTKLIDLELCYGSMSYNTLCSHLAACPNLRRLVLLSSSTQPFGAPCLRKKITKYCAKLKALGLNCTEGLPEVAGCDNSPFERGVVYMAIEFGRHFNIAQSTRQIEHQSHSLQRLTIFHPHRDALNYGSYDTNRAPRTYRMLHTLKYASDTNVSHFPEGYVPTIERFLGTIIPNSPNLSDLTLVHLYGSIHLRSILERSVQSKIQSLALNLVSFRATSHVWYRSFFSSFHLVHTLILGDCDVLSNGVLSSLSSSESLQNLTIINCVDVTNHVLTEFFTQVARKSSHRLNTINLNDILVTLDTSTIRALTKVKSLKTLRLTSCRAINAGSVQSLIREAPYSSLKTIEIRDCLPINTTKSWETYVDPLKQKDITLLIE